MKQPTFFSRWSLVILVVAVFLMPGIFGGALRAVRTNRNQVKEWLPADYTETAEFNWFLRHFAGGPFVLMSWEGCTLDDPRLTLLAEKLEPASIVKRHPESPKLFSRVITGRQVLDDLMSEPTKLSREEALERLDQALIGPDGKQTCLVIMFGADGEEAPRVALRVIRDIAVNECAIPEEAIHMGGPPVDNVALDEAGERSLMRLAALTGLVGLVVSWWCLRHWTLIFMVFFGGIYASAASMAVVWYSGGAMNSILLTMFPLVYVATMSGAIHLSNYYRETAREHGVYGATGRALALAAIPLCLATGTTAMGLSSLAISDLVPIQMFGIYSAIGVIISCLVLFLVLPAALELMPAVSDDEANRGPVAEPQGNLIETTLAPVWKVIGNFAVDRYWITAGAMLALLVVCGMGIPRITTSVKLMNFFSSESKIVKDYTWLEEQLGPLVPMEIVLCFDRQTCKLDMVDKIALIRRVQAQIDTLPDIGSTLSAATFSPEPPEPPKMSGTLSRLGGKLLGRGGSQRITRDVFNKQLVKHRPEYIENDYLSDLDDNEEVWRISARVGALNDIDYGTFVADLKQVVEPVLAQEAENGVAGVRAVYTGLVPLVYKSQRSLLDGLVIGFGTDLLLVIVVMMIMVHDVGAGLLLFIPAIFPGVVIFGLMGWMGIVVDVGTVMPPTVALGVTVDDVVHFLLWFRRGLQQGMTRREAVMLAYKDCARPMYQSWGVIGVGLAVFALSPFTPTQRFGYLMITLLSASLVGNLLLLPALLASPLGWFFAPWLQTKRYRERVRRQQQEEAEAAADTLPVSAAIKPVRETVPPIPAVFRSGEHRLRTDAPHGSLQ